MAALTEFSSGTSYDAPRASRTLFLFAEWANFFAIQIAVLFLAAVFTTDSFYDEFAARGFPIAVATFVGLSRLIHRINQSRAHARRGQQAKLIFEELKQGRIPPYSLYLRPFVTTGRLRVVNGRFRRRFLPSMDRFFGRRIDLETVFAIAHERAKHPLIAIGEVGFVSGAPKLVTADANWKEAFVRLAKGASAIIMVPLPRPSTVWVRLGVREPLEPFWEEIH